MAAGWPARAGAELVELRRETRRLREAVEILNRAAAIAAAAAGPPVTGRA